MGVPKFARFICERYPCILEILNEYQIPEFDNLYLDMNGIIHNCSHPNSADAHFRITEETIFKNIFHYVEELFRIIKPQKLFFMAVDGVAPRAKINQQRGRRFRAAKEAELAEAKARAKGETIPSESRFDSNCITPGTLFMAKLTEQLKYFVSYKISTDKLWQKCKVILSGPEVPGEGEHKIMDYIRFMKSQPDHDPNARHCLYGLDADLIMLSLCTHEPHFTVLREEVKYGKNLKVTSPEKVRFCLLHISLLREYMEHEFEPMKDKLSFPFDIEKILDDWILMGFLIGNDFIPHLPNLHIANGSLQILYQVYMEFLPTIDGYINEAGTLHLERFEKFMEKLSHIEVEKFADHLADLKYLGSKMTRQNNDSEDFDINNTDNDTFCEDVSLRPQKTINKELNNLIQMTDDLLIGHSDEEELLDTDSDNDTYNLEFLQHKRDYYKNKFDYDNIDEDFMRSQAEAYITAIQWNLHYYYDGCCSWSWYYPHHYAPYISDIKGFKDLKFNFKLDKPFLPFQQLLAVLPAASKTLLPEAYQKLLTEEESPIIDYYPEEFQTDLNEKKQEWEAVVLIPFVNEKKLIDAMEPLNCLLTEEEVKRNQHGPMIIITYSSEVIGTVNAPEFFTSVESHAKLIFLDPKEIEVPQDKLVKGLCKGVKLNVYYSGFPTFQHIKYTVQLTKAKVKVFEQTSRNDNMVLTIIPKEIPSFHDLARDILGKIVFIRWPHLQEALVIAISNGESRFSLMHPHLGYSLDNLNKEYVKTPGMHNNSEASRYLTRFGINVGEIKILVHVLTIDGRRYEFTNQGRLTLEKEWSEHSDVIPYQVIVRDIESQQASYLTQRDIGDIYTHKSICFMLGHPHYGSMGEVLESGYNPKTGRIKIAMRVGPEPNTEQLKMQQKSVESQYMNGNIASQKLSINKYLLIRITGSIYVCSTDSEAEKKTFNIGLNLKYTKKNEELPGYTRKINGQWLYSSQCIGLIRTYMNKFPEIFEFLSQNESEPYDEKSLFPNNPEKTAELLQWLQGLPTRNVDARNSDWDSLDNNICSKLQSIIEKYVQDEDKIVKTISMQVKPHLLFKPGLTMGNIPPDAKAKHFVFDRIISVKEESCVPLGYKGTIVGIKTTENSETIYDVYFDKEFVANITFSGNSTTHCFKLLIGEFINISHGLRAEQSLSEICNIPEKLNTRKKSTKPGFEVSNQNKPSAFASFNKVDNFLPFFCKPQQQQQHKQQQHYQQHQYQHQQQSQPPQKIQLMRKNTSDNKGPNSPIKHNNNPTAILSKVHDESKVEPKSPKIQDKNKSAPVSSSLPVNSSTNNPPNVQPVNKTNQQKDFQMLWNELQKTPIKTEIPSKMIFPMAPQIQNPMPNPHGPPLAPGADSPQDPSAFLKAVLRISDDKTNNSSSSNNMGKMNAPPPPPPPQPAKPFIFPSAPPVPQSTPPLVQQLFDHARQKNQKEGGQYYQSLLNHCKFFGMVPLKFVYHNEQNMIRAQLILPDLRTYHGNLCLTKEQANEDVCMKVMKELIVDRTPHVPSYYPGNSWVNMPVLQPPFSMQQIMQPKMFPEAQKLPVKPPPSWNQNQNSPQHHNLPQQHHNLPQQHHTPPQHLTPQHHTPPQHLTPQHHNPPQQHLTPQHHNPPQQHLTPQHHNPPQQHHTPQHHTVPQLHHNVPQHHHHTPHQNVAQNMVPTSNKNNSVQSPANEKVEVKKNTPFVPLQAQKKHRSRKPKDSLATSVDDGNKPAGKQQRSKPKGQSGDSPKKNKTEKSGKNIETKEQNQTNNDNVKENPQPVQKVQKLPGQRKSRIAANFGPSLATNGDKKQ